MPRAVATPRHTGDARTIMHPDDAPDARLAPLVHWDYAPASTAPPQLGATRPRLPRNLGHICPITREPLAHSLDLVLADDDYLYDRQALTQALLVSASSPMTRLPMPETLQELLANRPQNIALSPSAPLLRLQAVMTNAGALGGTIAGALAYARYVMPPLASAGAYGPLVQAAGLGTLAGGCLIEDVFLLLSTFGAPYNLRPLAQDQLPLLHVATLGSSLGFVGAMLGYHRGAMPPAHITTPLIDAVAPTLVGLSGSVVGFFLAFGAMHVRRHLQQLESHYALFVQAVATMTALTGGTGGFVAALIVYRTCPLLPAQHTAHLVLEPLALALGALVSMQMGYAIAEQVLQQDSVRQRLSGLPDAAPTDS